MFPLLVVVATLIAVASASSDVILKPKCGSGPTVALIFAPGAGLDPESYTPLAEAIQQKFCDTSKGYSLWVGIPHVPFDTATLGLKGAIARVAGGLTDAGLPTDHATMYGGHSLGGAVIPTVVKDPTKLPEGFDAPVGMVLMGAFLTRDYRTKADPEVGPGQYVFDTCPVLTIGAELDGLCRVTRIAESLHTQIDMANDPAKAKHDMPVTIISGMTHMQFSSGEPTKFVLQKDLIPEISYEDAHTAVANDFVNFAVAQMEGSFSAIDARVDATASFTAPIIKALKMEGYHQFKPPCYCEAVDEYGGLVYGTCPSKPGCQANSPWTEIAQGILVGQGSDLSDGGVQTTVHDSQHIVTEENPSCHLPNVHSGSDRSSNTVTQNTEPSANPGHNGSTPALCKSSGDCTLDISTVTQLIYSTGSEMDIWRLDVGSDSIDTGSNAISAKEMKAKMKSRQATLQAAGDFASAGTNDDSLEKLDGVDAGRCAEINQAALDYATNNIAPATLQRYQKYGQPMVIDKQDKYVCLAGPCWIWAGLEYNGNMKSDVISIKAPSGPQPNSNPFPCGEKGVEGKHLPCPAGMHYCKLLSPARSVEWMYVDSLRQKYSLKSQQSQLFAPNFGGEKNMTKCCSSCDTENGYEKYYSIAKLFNNCGESCIQPKDFWKYKILEPGLKKADTNTPCLDRQYDQYLYSPTHGEHVPGPTAQVDLYAPHEGAV